MRPVTIFLFLTLFMTLSLRGQVIYVRSASSGSNNGASWANAYTSLQPALAAATSGKQIWVAKGTYKPTTGTDRAVSFQMKNGIKIYGGFAGTETSISQRTNYEAGSTNETFLSGDIGTAGVNIDNSYHVISNSGIDNSALLDGFTITGGYADLYSELNYSQAMGGGMYNLNSSPTLTRCNFSNNYAYYGGGIYNETSSPSVTNCSFNHNSTLYDGGGIFNYSNSNQTVTRCNFTNNSADSGGGIANYNNPSSTISGCTFDGNLAGHGGALSNYNSSPITTGCIFRNNSTQYGGAIYNGENSSAAITSCLFVHNSAEFGGGIENFNSSPAIINCTFYGNSSKTYLGGCAVYNDEPSRPIIKNSIFRENLITSNSFVSDIYGGVAENITYCCFQEGKTIYTGKGNIFCIPAFSGAAGDDFSLLDNSPCIGAGTTTGAPATDILGLTRGTPPDMGAYENGLNAPNIKIIYVKANATGKNDGTSWANAYTSLQLALKDALLYDQIWVAKGTYKPTIGTDRNISFSMKNGVEIYGGFAGTEAELSFRKNYGPGEANETILSGDIGNEADSTDNSYHVFYHSEELLLNATAILDGFTITGGYANGTDDYWGSPSNHGGGMINYQASPTIRNCTFEGNCANDGGGGMFNWEHSSPLITNTLFTRNHVFGVTATEEGGGGMYNDNQSSPEITHCTFSYNKAFVVDGSSVFSNGGGGGVFNDNGSSPVIDQCRFIGNFTDFFGGGVNYYLSTANITRCVFDGNEGFGGGIQLNEGQTGTISNCLFTNNKGGGIYAAMETSANVVNCTFSKNSGDYASGLRVYNNSCSIDIINSIFWGDTQSGSNHIEITKYDNVVASNCCIQSGSDRFSGNNNIFTNPLFVDATHGDFHLSAGSPCISKGLNPAENNLIPLVDLDGNIRPLGSKTDMGAYECCDDGTVPGPTTFVLSNEEGGLIDQLIAGGYGNSNLYEGLVALEPASGGVISDEFMDKLASSPAGSQIFKKLSEYAHLNGGIAINTDGTAFTTTGIKGRDYYGKEGYATYPESQAGVGRELFTFANDDSYYINAVNGSTTYKVFAIGWSQAPSSTLSVSTNTLNVASANGSMASFNVTSNSSWTATSNQT
ncbi:MAG TPA: right-handed parallel beta-helix repeat-containing protein, partial [Prolixibacteraceae bacterium]|nr:right-handed parallel beta-helix repeat-containing protein [Prolixibacteraceae bacterium]